MKANKMEPGMSAEQPAMADEANTTPLEGAEQDYSRIDEFIASLSEAERAYLATQLEAAEPGGPGHSEPDGDETFNPADFEKE